MFIRGKRGSAFSIRPSTIFSFSSLFHWIELFLDFVLWTGDSSPHWNNPAPKWDYIYSVETLLVKLFKKYFPKATILPVLGNHDSYPPDYFPGMSDIIGCMRPVVHLLMQLKDKPYHWMLQNVNKEHLKRISWPEIHTPGISVRLIFVNVFQIGVRKTWL